MFAGGQPPRTEKPAKSGEVIILDQHDVMWRRFQRAFLKSTGLDLSEYREPQIRKRVTSVAAASGETIDSLADRLESGPVLASVTLHQIAIHTTQLFRDYERWIDLEENVLLDLARGNKSLTVWSAACANGAEAYSLASILENKNIPGRILATDVDSIILAQAVKGKFTQAQARQARPFLNPLHFEYRSESIQASKRLGRKIAFDRHNVLAEPPDYHFDLICCRNLAIYLKEGSCDRLYRNLWRALRPGGYLFVGASERIFAMKEIGFEAVSPCFYRKVVA